MIHILTVEKHLFPEHLSSPPVFSGVRVTQSLILCVMFCRSLFILLSFFFWPLCCLYFDCTNSDYHFDIFKLFFQGTLFIGGHNSMFYIKVMVHFDKYSSNQLNKQKINSFFSRMYSKI